MRYHDSVGRRRKRGRLLRVTLLIGLVAVLAWLGLGWRVGSHIARAQEALLAGDAAAATGHLKDAAFYRLRAGQVREARGALALSQGRLDEAEAQLQAARAAGVGRSGLDLDLVGAYLADQARYRELDMLAGHRQLVGGDNIGTLWRAEAALAQDRLDEAARLLGVDSSGPADRRERLSGLLAERRREGRADVIFDRQGRPLYGRQLSGGEPVLEAPELGGALTGEGGLLSHLDERDRSGRIDLSLDLVYQRAAHAALGRYAGAFVAVDPDTGALLALVSHPADDDGGVPGYRRLFEPGSVMKMITLAAAMDAGIDLGSMFPLNCTGNMTLDGQAFYDWTRHDAVADANGAAAVSCNLAFAAMGLEMGQARLDDALKAFGFDRTLDLPDLDLPTGRLLPIDPKGPRLGLAQRAVGLENVLITPAHAALLAAALAHGGTLMRPYLVASRSSLGADKPYSRTQPEPLLEATSPEIAAVVAEAMEAVVTAEDGTGRRAALDGLRFAMKTGTAGDRREGLNSVIFGFAPLENPRVAFAFIAEHAGKAEMEGARIARDFLATVRSEIESAP